MTSPREVQPREQSMHPSGIDDQQNQARDTPSPRLGPLVAPQAYMVITPQWVLSLQGQMGLLHKTRRAPKAARQCGTFHSGA